MKCILETSMRTQIHRDIELTDSPTTILRRLYEEEPEVGKQLFSNQKAIDQFLAGNVDESKASFDLVTVSGDNLRTVWSVPLCEQPSIKEALAKLEAEGQTPIFTVTVASIVA